MYLRPVIAVVLRYYYLLRGTPARWVPIFAWVAIDIVLWGFISKYLNSVTSSGVRRYSKEEDSGPPHPPHLSALQPGKR